MTSKLVIHSQSLCKCKT